MRAYPCHHCGEPVTEPRSILHDACVESYRHMQALERQVDLILHERYFAKMPGALEDLDRWTEHHTVRPELAFILPPELAGHVDLTAVNTGTTTAPAATQPAQAPEVCHICGSAFAPNLVTMIIDRVRYRLCRECATDAADLLYMGVDASSLQEEGIIEGGIFE